MKDELCKTLTKTFPKLVSKDFYFEIDDGWFQLVYDLFTKIQEHCNKSNITVTISQVKEKFGGLRVYYTCEGVTDDNVLFDLVMEAQNKSYTICEITGGAGSTHNKGSWIKTLCKESAILLGYN